MQVLSLFGGGNASQRLPYFPVPFSQAWCAAKKSEDETARGHTWNVQISGWVDTSKFNLLVLSKHLSAVECYKEAFALEGPEDLQFILSHPYPAPLLLLP